MKKILLFSLIFVATSGWSAPSVNDLTLEEQIGQTIMPRVLVGEHKAFKKAVLAGQVTGFTVKTGEGLIRFPHLTPKKQAAYQKKQYKRLQKTIADLKKDYEGGTVTSPMFMGLKQMPSNMLLGAAHDDQVITDMYTAQALEVRKVGGNMVYGPVTDVNSNPLNPIIQTRSFGSSAEQVGHNAALAVRALEQNGVAAVNKHFPGHGDTSVDSHYEKPVTALDKDTLWKRHTSAFLPSVQAGVYGVMNSHVVFPALDNRHTASFSPRILQDLLRREMHFDGVIITDGLDMGALKDISVEEMVRQAYKAGNNILLLSGDVRNIKETKTYPQRAIGYVRESVLQVESGNVPAEKYVTRQEIEDSAARVLVLKEKLGLFTSSGAAVPKDTGFEQAAHRASEKGVTLVRNMAGVVPLKKSEQKICSVFFADAIFGKQLRAFDEYLVSRGKRIQAIYSPRTPSDKVASFARVCAQNADVLVLGTSRTSVMDERQETLVKELLEAAATNGQKTVLLSLLNPYEIPAYLQAKTVLALYGPTVDSMQVAAQILLGERKAQGKLPITW